MGIRIDRGEFFLTMHSDVFVKQEGWLDPFLREMAASPRVAGSGAWKLALENPLYAWQKRLVGACLAQVKRWLGKRSRSSFRVGHYPRDYCAMYRTSVLTDENLTFCPGDDLITGGYSIARQLWSRGYETRMVPVWELAGKIVHVAHGTAAVTGDKPLHHRSAQRRAQSRARALLTASWIEQLRRETFLDAA